MVVYVVSHCDDHESRIVVKHGTRNTYRSNAVVLDEEKGEITLNLFGRARTNPQDHTPTTTKGWRSVLMPR